MRCLRLGYVPQQSVLVRLKMEDCQAVQFCETLSQNKRLAAWDLAQKNSTCLANPSSVPNAGKKI